MAQLPLIERKERLKRLFKKAIQGLRYNEHLTGDGPRFREHAAASRSGTVLDPRALTFQALSLLDLRHGLAERA
jgi:hypothetical protein